MTRDYRPCLGQGGAEIQGEGRPEKERYVFSAIEISSVSGPPPSSGDIMNVRREDKADHSKRTRQKSEPVTDLSAWEKTNQGGGIQPGAQGASRPPGLYAALSWDEQLLICEQ